MESTFMYSRLEYEGKQIFIIFKIAILKIGAIIHYDFSEKLPKLKNLTIPASPEFDPQETLRLREEVDYWRGKYISLLEEHNKVLKG